MLNDSPNFKEYILSYAMEQTVSLQNMYAEALTPSMIVSGDQTLGNFGFPSR